MNQEWMQIVGWFKSLHDLVLRLKDNSQVEDTKMKSKMDEYSISPEIYLNNPLRRNT